MRFANFAMAALVAAVGVVMFAQAAKVPTVGAAPAAVKERPLTEAEALRIRLTASEIKNLQDKYKITEFNDAVKPISDEQMAVVTAACASVGVDKDHIPQECGLQTGYDDSGKPILGADGKPVAAKVWKQEKVPAPIPSTEKK